MLKLAVEVAAALTGLVSAWLTVVQRIGCFPSGIVSSGLYAWVFFHAKLYSDMLLQVVFIVLQVYGWWCWGRGEGGEGRELRVIRLSRRGWWLAGGAAVFGTATLGGVMHALTDAALPFPDALAAVLSLLAQTLLSWKVFEAWGLWITVDVISLGLYWSRQLHPTFALYVVFLCLAIRGHREWKQSLATANLPPDPAPPGVETTPATPPPSVQPAG